MSRLFVAVPIPQSLRERLRAMAQVLEGETLRRIPPENWHLTVAFLGERDGEETLEAFRSLRDLPSPGTQFLDRWIVFSSVVGVGGLPACDTLLRLDEKLRAAIPEIEARPLFPHVSLARLRGTLKPSLPAPFPALELPVGEIVLYESSRGSYLPLSRIAL